MIPNGEKRERSTTLATRDKSKGREAKYEGPRWHYLAVKTLSALLRAKASKSNGDFHCLNCLELFSFF